MPSAEVFGLPKIIINFKTQSTSAIMRSARGIGVMILNDTAATTAFKYYKVDSVTDIPDALTAKNQDLINKALLGAPYRLHVYVIPTESETIKQTTILTEIRDMKWNYICHPTGAAADQTALATFITTERKNRDKTFKAVVAAGTNASTQISLVNNYGVINFTTGNIKVGETTYTAAEYTSRIMGILCGLSLDRSATFYELPEVESCDSYADIDAAINGGQLCLIDEKDGNGVKIARGVNSLNEFTTDVGQDFRFIKIVEALDMIKDDIKDTFRTYYVGKMINDYEHKMLFVAAIMIYFNGLKGNVLDATDTNKSFVEIDTEAQKSYLTLHGEDVSNWTTAQIDKGNTGVKVFLRGKIYPVNAMEELTIDFVL